MAIEIKSSLLNANDMKHVKNSLVHVSEQDGEDTFRVRLVEYINDSSANNQDMFFYNALEFLRFLNPGSNDVAYTTPEKLIFLNAPNYKDIGKSVRKWEFVYDHECLHQLWDTFAVGDRIKEEKGSYDHQLLNIASDCVINDYLYRIRKKERPEFGIFPDVIKEKFGVEYDIKKDTQYTLYFKLLAVKEKIQKEIENNPQLKKLLDDMEQEGGSSSSSQSQSGESGQSSGSGQSGESSSSQNQPNNAEGAEQAAKEAQDAADKAKEQAQQAGDSGDEDADEKDELAKEAQDAADKAKEAAEKAKEAKKNGDKEGEKEAAKEAKEQAQKAKDALNKIKGEEGKDGKDGKEGKDSQNGKDSKDSKDKQEGQDSKDGEGKGAGNGHADILETPEELEKIRSSWKDLLDEYGKKLAGDFGEFIKKCKSSRDCVKNGLEVNTRSGVSGWNEKMNSYVNTYVKKKVYQKKREFQETYSRIRRGSGYVEYGKPIKPGKKIREEKLNINVAFYIDRSGSMHHCIDQVFKACYTISEALQKKFRKEQVVNKVDFKVFAFDDKMIEIKYGNKCNANGGTMPFHQILKFISNNTENFMINIIITDAEFDINNSEVENFMKNIKDMLLFITNNDNSTMKNLSKKYDTQLFYVLADQNFEIK